MGAHWLVRSCHIGFNLCYMVFSFLVFIIYRQLVCVFLLWKNRLLAVRINGHFLTSLFLGIASQWLRYYFLYFDFFILRVVLNSYINHHMIFIASMHLVNNYLSTTTCMHSSQNEFLHIRCEVNWAVASLWTLLLTVFRASHYEELALIGFYLWETLSYKYII